MRILIVGKKGQLGQHLVEKKINIEVLLALDLVAVDLDEIDITEPLQVNKLVQQFKPNIIINAAAYTAVEQAEHDIAQTFNVNGNGVRFLAQAAATVGAIMIHISTDYVFDGKKAQPYTEMDTCSALNVYGKSKLAGEREVVAHCQQHIIIRTAWLFSEQSHNFVSTMLKLSQTHCELNIVDDQVGGPTYAGDLADMIIAIVNKIERKQALEWGTYHYSGWPYVSWFQFAQAIFNQAYEQKVIVQLPKVFAISTELYPSKVSRPANSRLDCTKMAKCFDISMSDWQAALPNVIKSLANSDQLTI